MVDDGPRILEELRGKHSTLEEKARISRAGVDTGSSFDARDVARTEVKELEQQIADSGRLMNCVRFALADKQREISGTARLEPKVVAKRVKVPAWVAYGCAVTFGSYAASVLVIPLIDRLWGAGASSKLPVLLFGSAIGVLCVRAFRKRKLAVAKTVNPSEALA